MHEMNEPLQFTSGGCKGTILDFRFLFGLPGNGRLTKVYDISCYRVAEQLAQSELLKALN